MKNYTDYTRKKKFIIISCLFVLVIILLVSTGIGTVYISPIQVLQALIGKGSALSLRIIWNIRLVRVLAATLVGLCLALSGTVMQCVLENPLASPFTMGISQGAAFGAAVSIVFMTAENYKSGGSLPWQTTIFAFLGALTGVAVVLVLNRIRSLSPNSLILAGIAMNFLFTSGLILLQYLASDQELSAIIFWTFGDLGRITWPELGLLTIITVPIVSYFFLNKWNYNALNAGDEVAKSLGVEAGRIRIVTIVLASLIAASTVSFVGIIGFIGLLGPHIMRGIIGSDYRFLIPASTIWGAILLMLSDIISRTVLSPILIPVGIVTSFMGAPLFLYIIVRGAK